MYDYDCEFDSSSDIESIGFEPDATSDSLADVSLDADVELLKIDTESNSDINDINAEASIEMLELDSDVDEKSSEDIPVTESFFDDFSLDEVEDGYYHATGLAQEDVQRIDDLWCDNSNSDDIETYHAEYLSDEDVARIDELNKEETWDVEPYKATYGESDVISDINDDAVYAEIETFEELKPEPDKMDTLNNEEDVDIFSKSDSDIREYELDERFNELIDKLPRESLEYLQCGLKNRDNDILNYFGLNVANDENDDTQEELILKRRR